MIKKFMRHLFGTRARALFRAHRREQEQLRIWEREQARRRRSLELQEHWLALSGIQDVEKARRLAEYRLAEYRLSQDWWMN